MNNKKILLITLIIAYALMFFLSISFADKTDDVDTRTKELCRIYADRDHEKELAPDRWRAFIESGINPNTHFDWYTSCINHVKYPVADY